MRIKNNLLILITTVILSACCAMKEKNPNYSGSASDPILSGIPITHTNPTELGKDGMPPMNPSALWSKRTIYFSYDDSQIQQNDIPTVFHHAQYLMDNPEKRIVLRGHADERGTREYNITLGELRAKSVYRMMNRHGVSAEQIEVVSYGEEDPASNGMNESAWQLNRRVEIIY